MSVSVAVLRRWSKRTVPALGCAWCLAGCGDSEPAPLEWRVEFACSSDQTATDQLTLRVLQGGCSGERVLYESSFGRGGSAAAKNLDEGDYGLVAVAESEAGVIAEACEQHHLPASESITLVLRSASCTAPVDAGMDARMDASVMADASADTAVPDAEVDAEPPCMPPKDCRPCAQDGDTSDCPPASCNEFSFGVHTYLVCSDKQQWAAARTQCRREDRDLAVIDSKAENDFIVSHIGGTTHWIGANDRGNNGINSCSRPIGAEEGAWSWIDPVSGNDKGVNFCNASGSSSACAAVNSLFMNWASGEPNNSGCECIPFYKCEDGEDCAAINGSGGWLDTVCSSGLPYVCESY